MNDILIPLHRNKSIKFYETAQKLFEYIKKYQRGNIMFLTSSKMCIFLKLNKHCFPPYFWHVFVELLTEKYPTYVRKKKTRKGMVVVINVRRVRKLLEKNIKLEKGIITI